MRPVPVWQGLCTLSHCSLEVCEGRLARHQTLPPCIPYWNNSTLKYAYGYSRRGSQWRVRHASSAVSTQHHPRLHVPRAQADSHANLQALQDAPVLTFRDEESARAAAIKQFNAAAPPGLPRAVIRSRLASQEAPVR